VRVLVVLLFLVLVGCKPSGGPSDAPQIITTTTMLADMVSQIVGPDVRVRSLVSPGADPHLYQPTPKDVRDIAGAKLVVTNGLGLEGWVDNLVRNAGKDSNKKVVVASSGIAPLIIDGAIDPHFWFDVSLWSQASHTVEDAIIAHEIIPETQASKAGTRLRNELNQLHSWALEQVSQIPDTSRTLVTSHDAFHYFGRAYGMEVVGIQGVSTEFEASQRDIINVIEVVKKQEVRAIFTESSVNPALVEQVARETSARISGPLYSDSLGPSGSGAETYIGMVTANVSMIVDALGGSTQTFTGNLQ